MFTLLCCLRSRKSKKKKLIRLVALQVQAAEDLLQLTRQLKELWLGGPLRDIGEGEGDGEIGEDSKKVGELVEGILKRTSELTVGSDGADK
jgi:hypothetical protein